MALQKANQGGATPFKFVKAGDTLKGYYLGQVEKVINGSKAIEHTYKTKEGRVSVLGQANILRQYENNGVTPGTYVEVAFSGETMKLKGGRTMKVYDVAFDTEDRHDGAVEASDDSGFESESEAEEQEAPIQAAVAPKVAAQVPSAERQARLQAMISKNR